MFCQFLLLGGFLSLITSEACTTFAVGRKATVDGSVMASHTNDGSGTTDPRLVRVPAMDYAADSERPIFASPESYPRYVGYERNVSRYYPENCDAGEAKCAAFVPIGYIPQVPSTFSYFEATYGIMNEHQVGIAESTCSGVYSAKSVAAGGLALLSIDQLSQIAMERSTSARDAVSLMGSLAEKYGFYGASFSFEGGSESLIVTDSQDAWVFHILADPTGTSAIWVAARVPDDSVAVVANMFSVREVDLSDSNNFLGRSDMWDIALAEGLWQEGLVKDFTATFSDGEYAHKYYSGRRMWIAFHRLAPSLQLLPVYDNLKMSKPYPFAVRVDAPVNTTQLFNLLRDWYEDTPYTAGEGSGLAGGAFSSPDRYTGGDGANEVSGSWERSIALFRSSDTYIVQSSSLLPRALGGVIWFGPHAAHSTVYTPIMSADTVEYLPDCLSFGWQGVFNTSTSFWAFRNLLTLAQAKFSYMITHVRTMQTTLESNSVDLLDELADTYSGAVDQYGALPQAAKDDISFRLRANVELARDSALELSQNLLFSYADGFLNKWEDGVFTSKSLGYPAWWLKSVGYDEGPPPVNE